MADTIERLYKLTVDATAAIAQLQKFNDATEKSGAGLVAFGNKLVGIGKTIAATWTLDKVVETFHSTVDAMDETVKAAQRVGVASDELQRLRYSASTSGASAEDMDKALVKLSTHLVALGDDTQQSTKLLKAFGVTGADTAQTALFKIANGFQGMADGASKTAAAMVLFGKEAGTSLIPALNDGAKGLQNMARAADDLGLVIGGQALRAAKELNDQFDTLGRMSAVMRANFVTGLLPAITALVTLFADLRKSGLDMKAWGDAIGEDIVRVTMGVVLLVGALEDLLAIQEGIRKFAVSPIWKWGEVYTETMAKISKNNEETIRGLEILKTTWQNTKKAIETPFVGPPEPTPLDKLRELLKAQEDAARRAKEALEVKAAFERREAEASRERYEMVIKLQKELNEEAGKAVNVQHLTKDALDQTNKSLETQADAQLTVGKVYQKVNDDAAAYVKTQDEQVIRLQALHALYDKSTGPVKEWAKAQIEAAEASAEQNASMKALSDSWDRFLDSVSSGSVTVAQSFRAMAQSLIADLLKIWSKKFILDALSHFFTGGTPAAGSGGQGLGDDSITAHGNAFAAGRLLPFARGGILSSPVRMPMALMGEAGPEAVMPLRRGADGNLGVAAAASALNVTINNHTDATVSARRGSGGDLQILIEQTKRSLAADFRRGGNDVSRAAEAAWGLNRGAAAPF